MVVARTDRFPSTVASPAEPRVNQLDRRGN